MDNGEKQAFQLLTQILELILVGKATSAIELFENSKKELDNQIPNQEFLVNFKAFIQQYADSAIFLGELANGNLNISPPQDPKRENYLITQLKQLHSNLLHLTWQTKQIAKGDLNQKLNFLGEFSTAFNEMIESLREKKLMEEKLNEQFLELQKVNAEKDKFFSIIAHDLRNPFVSFLGFTELMADEFDAFSMDEIRQMAYELKSSANNLHTLLENLLEWSRVQRGLVGMDSQPIELLPIITEIMQPVFESALKKDIVISIHIPENLIINADLNMLSSTVRNLATNAVKFTPKSGKITITAKIMNDNSVLISVSDSGIGMNQTLLEKLFRMNENTSRPGTEGEASTGLGLLLCKDFVEKQGGKIWAESEEGKGSTFCFTIPVKTME